MTIHLASAVTDICQQLELEPRWVARLELRPRQVTAITYKRNANGDKYIDDDGEAATNTIHYPATWQPEEEA